MLSSVFVTIVLPVCELREYTRYSIEQVAVLMKSRFYDYEILIIDDQLEPAFESILNEIQNLYDNVRLIRLAAKYGVETAASIGIENSIGDYLVVFHPDEDPVEEIPKILRHCIGKADITYGIDKQKQTRRGFPALLSNLYYWYVQRFANMNIPRYRTYLSCLSRAAITRYKQSSERQWPGKYLYTKNKLHVSYYPHTSIGVTNYRTKRTVRNAVSGGVSTIVLNTTHPLKIVRFFILSLAVFFGIFSFYLLTTLIILSDSDTALSNYVVCMSFAVWFLCLLLSVLSEYTLRTLILIQNKVSYDIQYDKRSPTMLNKEQLNIIVETNDYA